MRRGKRKHEDLEVRRGRGSSSEADTQLQISRRLGLLEANSELDESMDGTFAKLGALINSPSSEPQGS